MREYLDPVVKADQCAQNVDDIGTAANNATDLTQNIRAVFKYIRQAELRLTIEKCYSAFRQAKFLCRNISYVGVTPQSHKIKKLLSRLRFSKSKKRIPYKNLDLKMGNPPQKLPSPDSQIPQDVLCLHRWKGFCKMSSKLPCKLISKTKLIMIKKPMPQNSNKQNTFTS